VRHKKGNLILVIHVRLGDDRLGSVTLSGMPCASFHCCFARFNRERWNGREGKQHVNLQSHFIYPLPRSDAVRKHKKGILEDLSSSVLSQY